MIKIIQALKPISILYDKHKNQLISCHTDISTFFFYHIIINIITSNAAIDIKADGSYKIFPTTVSLDN